jgi:hypothetical protein
MGKSYDRHLADSAPSGVPVCDARTGERLEGCASVQLARMAGLEVSASHDGRAWQYLTAAQRERMLDLGVRVRFVRVGTKREV